MACEDCLKTCNGIITPDKCIQYTGADIELLGVCQGDSLFEVEEIILNKLLELMDGTGITIEGLDMTCSLISGIQSTQETTVPILFQTLISAACSLQGQITIIETQINTGYSFDIDCLIGITPTSSRDQILQSVIHKTCDNDTRITNIESDYVKSSELCALVTSCIGSGPTVTDYNLRMIPGVVYPYVGSLSNFDNTGKGIVSVGFDKIYLMNGLNGTQDWRGRSPIGAIQNVPGGTLDPAVDPALPANVGTNYVINQKVGASSVVLSINQIPSHNHIVNDPGHRHQVQDYAGSSSGGNHIVGVTNSTIAGINTAMASTGITLSNTGSSLAHTNLQPSIASYYIIYIP